MLRLKKILWGNLVLKNHLKQSRAIDRKAKTWQWKQ